MFRLSGLRAKTLILIFSFVAVFCLALTAIVGSLVLRQSADGFRGRAQYVTHGVAYDAAGYILSDDILGLESYLINRLLIEGKTGHGDFLYFFVLDKKGRVLAHTFGDVFPVELKDANRLMAGEDQRVRRLKTEKGPIMDVVVPIGGGKLGLVRAGLSVLRLDQILARIWAASAAVLLCCFLIIFPAVILFTRPWFKPLDELEDAVERIRQGDYAHRIKVSSPDETGRLIGLFNEMAGKVQAAISARDGLIREMKEYKVDEAWFKVLADNLDVGVCRSTPGVDGTLINANPAVIKLLEADSKDELLGAKIGDFYADPSNFLIFVKKLMEAGKVKDHEAELITRKGRKFWASVTATFFSNDKGEEFFYCALWDISKYRDAVEKVERSYDIQSVLSGILSLSSKRISIPELLEYSLNEILSIPWLSLESKGAIFLVEDDPDTLVLKAQRNLPVPIQNICNFVAFGKCLCGRAAKTGELVFSRHIDQLHENIYTNMPDHGHYCLPLKSCSGKVLGVLNLYVRSGHLRDSKEESFIVAVAGVLAAIIERKKMEESLLSKIDEVDRLNHFMIGREKRVIELKKEVDSVMKEAGRSPRYNIF